MIRIVLRPVASGLPLGFLAFGAGTILLTALELSWVPPGQGAAIMVLVLAFVVPLELLAGIFAFLARDGGAATGLSMLAAAWAGTAISLLRSAPGARSTVLGIFLLFLATAMLLVISAARAKPLFSVLFAAGASRFALTGAYQVTGDTGLERAAGWIGLPLLALCRSAVAAAPGRRWKVTSDIRSSTPNRSQVSAASSERRGTARADGWR